MDASLEGLIYHISHDLNAPIRRVNSLASLLQTSLGTAATEDQASYLRHLNEQSALSLEMLEALLELSRLESLSPTLQWLKVGDLFATIASDWPTLTVCRDIDADLAIPADPALLRSLFGELASNVLDHAGIHTWRVAASQAAGQGVTLQLDDAGPGLTAAEWQRYLIPFACSRGRPVSGHLGMGLARVERIAKLHRASLTWHEVPVGLSLRLTFPGPH